MTVAALRLFHGLIMQLGFPHYYILGLCIVCAATDIQTGRIYNVITLPSILVGIAWNAVFADGGALAGSLSGLALGIIPFGFGASRGWIGSGDMKLFAAVGAVGGFFILLDILLVAFVIAGAYSMAVLLRRHGIPGALARVARGFAMVFKGEKVDGAESTEAHIRLGVFVLAGAVVVILGAWALQ